MQKLRSRWFLEQHGGLRTNRAFQLAKYGTLIEHQVRFIDGSRYVFSFQSNVPGKKGDTHRTGVFGIDFLLRNAEEALANGVEFEMLPQCDGRIVGTNENKKFRSFFGTLINELDDWITNITNVFDFEKSEIHNNFQEQLNLAFVDAINAIFKWEAKPLEVEGEEKVAEATKKKAERFLERSKKIDGWVMLNIGRPLKILLSFCAATLTQMFFSPFTLFGAISEAIKVSRSDSYEVDPNQIAHNTD